MKIASFSIKADTYSLEERQLEGGMISGRFQKRYPHRKHRFEIFPHYWHLAMLRDIRPGQITVRTAGTNLPVVGTHALFLPAYSILEWELGPGEFLIDVIKSKNPLPEGIPQTPLLLRPATPSDSKLPTTEAEVCRCFQTARSAVVLTSGKPPNSVARRAKAYLDAHFLERLPINQVAAKLNVSRSVMTRSFSRSYGLSPVLYRNHLRVFEAMALLSTNNCSVAEASQQCGFTELSNFNRHFKRIIEQVPSAFRSGASFGISASIDCGGDLSLP